MTNLLKIKKIKNKNKKIILKILIKLIQEIKIKKNKENH